MCLISHSLSQVWPASAMSSAISFSMDCMALWRDRIINPWKHNRIFYTDAELDAIIDRIFRQVYDI